MSLARVQRCGWVVVLGVAVVTGLAATVVPVAHAAVAPDRSLTIGAKDFDGAQALTQVYGQALEAKGYDIAFRENLGTTEVVYPALLRGEIDAYADYQGTLLQYLGGQATGDAATTSRALAEKLAGTGIVASRPARAVDVNGFYVTEATAKRHHLETVSDLVDVAPELTLGGPPECEERDLCLGPKSQATYGLQFAEVRKLDAGGPITVRALEDGDVDVAVLFTGSSAIPDDAVLLEDDRDLQPADQPVLLVREADATAATMKIADAVSAKLTTRAYNRMSLDISERGADPADVAAAFLRRKGLD